MNFSEKVRLIRKSLSPLGAWTELFKSYENHIDSTCHTYLTGEIQWSWRQFTLDSCWARGKPLFKVVLTWQGRYSDHEGGSPWISICCPQWCHGGVPGFYWVMGMLTRGEQSAPYWVKLVFWMAWNWYRRQVLWKPIPGNRNPTVYFFTRKGVIELNNKIPA